MNFEIDHELEMIRTTARGFVDQVLIPLENQVEEADAVPPETMRRLRHEAVKLGLYGYNMPSELGGPGLSTFAQVLIDEEVGRTTLALAESVRQLPLSLRYCTPEQHESLLPALMAGEVTITYALTEPDAGSDLNALRTRAKQVDGGWLLNGRKQFISNAETADHIIVLAVTDPEAALNRGRLTTFLVERGNAGLKDFTRFKKMGWRGYHLNAFAIEDCFVPDRDVLGQVGHGFRSIMSSINYDRLSVAGRCVGLAHRANEMSKKYATERVTFGAKLSEHQAIQFMVADNDVELEAARMLVYRAADLADRAHPDFRIAASRAKLYSTETLGRVVDRSLQIFGGAGFMCEWPIERFYRDARAFRIGEGTSEMQRIQIARHVLAQAGA